MNKLYITIVMFAIGGLLFTNVPLSSNAASNLEYMLTITEKAEKWCKSEIEMRENVAPEILELYRQSISDIDKLKAAIDVNDVKSAREYFVSSMQTMRQISLTLDQPENLLEKQYSPTQKNPILDRFEFNISKLKSVSSKLGANIDFHEIDDLIILANENHANGNTEKTKQLIAEIATKGLSIYHSLQTINEEIKIIRAKVLAEKHIEKITILISEAKELGLQDSVKKLEQTKINLISANNTSQIKQNVKLVIIVNNAIEKSKSSLIEESSKNDIKSSNQEKLSLQISQLENKLNNISSDVHGNNIAIYYLEKASGLVKSAKLDLNDSLDTIPKKIQMIESIISKIEKSLEDTA